MTPPYDDSVLKVDETVKPRGNDTLYLGLRAGKNYGWGVCMDYLIKELSRMKTVHALSDTDGSATASNLPGPLLQALTDVNFDPLFPQARGAINLGYTFFESELTRLSVENAKNFDQVLAGSSWCRERMAEAGITNTGVLIQGVDPTVFHPIETEKAPETFVIFSGGKFEYRKGQDLVLKATAILHQKYADLFLVTCWYNMWPQTMKNMSASRHIRFIHDQNRSWQDNMNQLYSVNGLDPSRVITLGLTPNAHLRRLYRQTDLGVFPNRCEGGTNLVLMEYMACAKPVIASFTSGHKDILTKENALLLDTLSENIITDDRKKRIARWEEPSLDELVEKIEFAYHHRKAIRNIGMRAGSDLKQYTWRDTAVTLLRFLESMPD